MKIFFFDRKYFFEKNIFSDFFEKKNEHFRKMKISKNWKIKLLKIGKFSDFSKFSGKMFFSKKFFRSKKYFFKKLFDGIFSEHHFRQATLTRDASRAPRSDVAALRRKGNSQNPHFGAEIPILARLGQAEQLTIPATTVVLPAGRWEPVTGR